MPSDEFLQEWSTDNVRNFNAFLTFFNGIALVTVGNKTAIRIRHIEKNGDLWECIPYHTNDEREHIIVKAGSPIVLYLGVK